MPLNSGIIISRQASWNASFVYHLYTFTAIQPLNQCLNKKVNSNKRILQATKIHFYCSMTILNRGD